MNETSGHRGSCVVAPLTGERLRESGFEVVEAADGEQGSREAETGQFDVIVLDLMLPKSMD